MDFNGLTVGTYYIILFYILYNYIKLKLNAINMNVQFTCYVYVHEYLKSFKFINIKKPFEKDQIKLLWLNISKNV